MSTLSNSVLPPPKSWDEFEETSKSSGAARHSLIMGEQDNPKLASTSTAPTIWARPLASNASSHRRRSLQTLAHLP